MANPNSDTVQGLSAELKLDFSKLEASLSKATAMKLVREMAVAF